MRPAVSIPFIAGQWSLHAGGDLAEVRRRVSIPFIAGQWSLPPRRMAGAGKEEKVSIPFIAGQWSLRAQAEVELRKQAVGLNPLHCGAVVASSGGSRRGGSPRPSQSPSLRGSGRFLFLLAPPPFGEWGVSIPFIAGQWSLQCIVVKTIDMPALVSIPFIAGQWSLL